MSPATAPAHDVELNRLEVLRSYKEHFVREGGVNLSPFAPDQVIRYDSDVKDYDVPDIHRAVRERLAAGLRGLHAGHPSQVAILAGDPGMGKSHLLNHFRSPQRAEELGYVFVGNSNHWKVGDFEACLLDWILEALVRPSPNGPHLLLEKVLDVAFEALRQILAQPGQLRHYERYRGGVLGRLKRLVAPSHDDIRKRTEARDASVFRRLNFLRFSKYICDRFLPRPGHPFHRYALQVLLRYVFEDERERVLHWLRGKDVDFARAVDVRDRVDTTYKAVDTIQILISLFTDEVARVLTPGGGASGRIFFFAFDQAEGRNELFEKKEEWQTFFAQLSELYNTLPNVFIVFTMTIALRQELYPKMEGQFKDRISRDPIYTLHSIDDAELLALYRNRVRHWLGESRAEVWQKSLAADAPYLPLSAEEVKEVGRTRTLRSALQEYDRLFGERLLLQVIGPRLDYLGFLNAFRAAEPEANPFEGSADHLTQVARLFTQGGGRIAPAFDVMFGGSEECQTTSGLEALRFEFRDPTESSRWVRVFLLRLGKNYSQHIDGWLDLLKNLQMKKNFLWIVRPTKVNAEWEEDKPNQIFARVLEPGSHPTIQAGLKLLANRDAYGEQEQSVVDTLLVKEIGATYLGEMLRQVRAALAAQSAEKTS